MNVNFSVLEGPYLHDLLAQPAASAATVAALHGQPPLPPRTLACDHLVLTGMGSSLHALYPLQLRLAHAGRRAHLVETAELVHEQSALLGDRTLVVAVSQSGRSVEIIQLLDLLAARRTGATVVAVTNTADSPLAQRADSVLLLHAGAEFSVSCKTYLATLLALEWLGGALAGDNLAGLVAELESAAPAVQAYLGSWREHVAQLAGTAAGIRHLFLTGRGSSLATVGAGALILKESAHFHAEGMSSPSFRHGPLELASPALFALVFAGDPAVAPLNEALVQDIGVAGGRAVLVGATTATGVFRLPPAPARLRPVLEMLPVQMLSLALAALAGREPGRFERATKVTTVA